MIDIQRYRSASEHQQFIVNAFNWSLTTAFGAKTPAMKFSTNDEPFQNETESDVQLRFVANTND